MGAVSVILYDSTMEDGARLDALSLLMKGETLPAGTAWAAWFREAPGPGPVLARCWDARPRGACRQCLALHEERKSVEPRAVLHRRVVEDD